MVVCQLECKFSVVVIQELQRVVVVHLRLHLRPHH